MTTNADASSSNRPAIADKRLWIPAAVVILFLLLISLVPVAMQYALTNTLQKLGADPVSIDDIDFNPFTGELVLSNLTINNPATAVATIREARLNYTVAPLFQRRLLLESVSIDGLTLPLAQSADGIFTVAGLALPQAEPEQPQDETPPWGVGIDQLEITDIHLNYNHAGHDYVVAIEDASISGLQSWNAAGNTNLQLSGAINDAALSIDGTVQVFSEQPAFNARITVQKLPLDRWQPFLPEDMSLAGALSMDSRFQGQLETDQTFTFSQDGSIDINGLQFTQAGVDVSEETLRWQGQTRYNSHAADATLNLEGALSARGSRYQLREQDIAVAYNDFRWQGAADMRMTEVPGSLALTGDLDIDGFTLLRLNTNLTIASFDSLSARLLAAENHLLKIEPLVVKGLVVPDTNSPNQVPVVRLASLTGKQLTLAKDNAVSIDKITLDNAAVHLQRGKSGAIAEQPGWQLPTSPEAEQNTEEKQVAAISIQHIGVTGDSYVQFSDASVEPPYDHRINIRGLTIGPLDPATSTQATRVVLESSLSKYELVNASGTVHPFKDPVDLDMKIDAKAIELPNLSPYAAHQLGRSILGGVLNSTIELKSSKGQLEGSSHWLIQKLKLGPKDPDTPNAFALPMPLDSALNMLRDSDGNIELDIPVTGDINNPEFDASDAINTAIGSAMKTASLSYLKYTLQPYGALLSIAQMAGKAATAVRLEAIQFAPGSSELGPESLDYISRITKLLQERPGLHLQLCSVATRSDADIISPPKQPVPPDQVREIPPELREQLVNLAKARGSVIKDHLVATAGIDAARLLACLPVIDKDPAASPRVELAL